MMTYILFAFCLFYPFCLGELVTSLIAQITDMDNFRPADNAGVVIPQTSVLQCAIECTNNLSCNSLSYHSVQGSCILYPCLFNKDTVRTEREDGWTSYRQCRGQSSSTNSSYIYNQTLDWSYRLVEGNKLNATEASDFCCLDGARMIRITSQERQLHMMELLLFMQVWTGEKSTYTPHERPNRSDDRSCEMYSHGIASVWIGGHSKNSDNIFVYEDGTPLSYFYWENGSPKGFPYIRLKSSSNFKWENRHGSKIRDFLCER